VILFQVLNNVDCYVDSWYHVSQYHDSRYHDNKNHDSHGNWYHYNRQHDHGGQQLQTVRYLGYLPTERR